MNVFNALISGQWTAFRSAAGHLILPAIALGTHPHGGHRPHDPIVAAGRAQPRLRPHRPGQGPPREARGHPPRPAQRHAAGVTVIGLSLGTLLGGPS